MAITIFDDAFTKMDDTIINILGTQTGALINIISPIIFASFTLYVLLIAMSYIKGEAQPIEMGFDLLYRIIAWAVILGLSMNIGNYTGIVVTIVNNLPNELTQAISGNANTSVTNGLDQLISLYIDRINELYNDIDFLDVGGYVAASVITLILCVCAIPFLVAAGGFILLAKIMSAVLLVLGPVFIILALFPATRQYFSLWLGQIVNYMLMLLIINILATIQIAFLTDVINTSVDLDFTTSLSIGVASMLFFVVVLKVPDISSSLSNGLAINGFNSAYRSLGGGRGNSGGGKNDGGSGGDKGSKDSKNSITSKIKPEKKGV